MSEEGEIGVFAAEKYYNMQLDEDPDIGMRISRYDVHGTKPMSTRHFLGTSSSMSTQAITTDHQLAASLPTLSRNISQHIQNKVIKRSNFLLATLNPCFDMSSIPVHRNVNEQADRDNGKRVMRRRRREEIWDKRKKNSQPDQHDRKELVADDNVKTSCLIVRSSNKADHKTTQLVVGKDNVEIRSRSGGFLGCKNHKAVTVAETTEIRINEKAGDLVKSSNV